MPWDGWECLRDLAPGAPGRVLGLQDTCFSCHVIPQAATFLILCLLLATRGLLFQALSWLLVACTCPCKAALSVSPAGHCLFMLPVGTSWADSPSLSCFLSWKRQI